jgi:esterase/lipase
MAMKRSSFRFGTAARAVAFIFGGLIVIAVVFLAGAFLWLSWLPIDAQNFSARTTETVSASTYTDAISDFRKVRAGEATMSLHPLCGSTLFTHGKKVARAVVFFHGLTNCPAQADKFAEQLFALGYNVYIPRLPGHGEADPLTLALAQVTAEDLAGTAVDAVNLAGGLGDEVVVVGLSAGGIMSAWLAQNNSQADKAVLVAPFFGPGVVPSWALRAATNLLLLAPNMMIWWDASETDGNPAMDYAYPRFATHALAQVMRLGLIAEAGARTNSPAVSAIGVLLNEADESVNNQLTEDIVAAWRDHGQEVALYILPSSRNLPHDLIDPRQEDADIEFVYPLLNDMISRQSN